MKSQQLREALGLSRIEWAHALNVNERTVSRWEDGGVDPGGTSAAVMKGIASALEEGVDPQRASRLIGLGISALVYYRLTTR